MSLVKLLRETKTILLVLRKRTLIQDDNKKIQKYDYTEYTSSKMRSLSNKQTFDMKEHHIFYTVIRIGLLSPNPRPLIFFRYSQAFACTVNIFFAFETFLSIFR